MKFNNFCLTAFGVIALGYLSTDAYLNRAKTNARYANDQLYLHAELPTDRFESLMKRTSNELFPIIGQEEVARVADSVRIVRASESGMLRALGEVRDGKINTSNITATIRKLITK